MTDTERKILTTKFEDHCESNRREFKRLNESVNQIKNNHLEHLKADVDELGKEVSQLQTNLDWVMKIQWLMITTAVANFAGIAYLIITKNL